MFKTMTFACATAAAAALLAVPAMAGGQSHHHRPRAATTSCVPTTQAMIDSQFARFNDAWATRNPDTVTALFAADAVVLPTLSNRPRTDHASIRDYFVSFLRNAPVGTINTGTTMVGCNMAYRVGTWTVRLTNPDTGVATDVAARYSFIYRYVNGGWKIQHLHSSVMPEAAPAH